MIRLLQKAKAKRGFSLLEMIVVIAIIGVLAAVILPSMNTQKAMIGEANSNAKSFYVAMQTIFTKYSLYEAPLSQNLKSADGKDFIQFFPSLGGNYPYNYNPANTTVDTYPAEADIYIEVKVISNDLTEVIVENSWEKILKRDTKTGANPSPTEFASVLQTELDAMTTMPDGYYYAKVSYKPETASGVGATYAPGTVKVAFAAYRMNELPQLTGTMADYESSVLHFGKDNVIADGTVCGVCAKWDDTNTVGTTGTYLK